MRQAIEVPELEYFYLLIRCLSWLLGLDALDLSGAGGVLYSRVYSPNRRDRHDRRDGALEAGDRSQLFAKISLLQTKD